MSKNELIRQAVCNRLRKNAEAALAIADAWSLTGRITLGDGPSENKLVYKVERLNHITIAMTVFVELSDEEADALS